MPSGELPPLFAEIRQALQRSPARPLNLPGLVLRESAVLVPLFLRSGLPHVLFTRRPDTMKTHAGQISFPGGVRERGDPTPLHTALRETEEELGVPAEAVTVLGLLDEIPTITEFRISPFVGLVGPGVRWTPNEEEISEVIEVPLAHLIDPASARKEQWRVSDRERDVYFYDYGRHTIWGATARILKNLLEVLTGLPTVEELRRT